MIFTDANKEHSIKQMILHWSSRLVEAIQADDMPAAYDISRNTLPKCWDLYKQELRLNGKIVGAELGNNDCADCEWLADETDGDITQCDECAIEEETE
jgi:hypothetical protein